MANYKLLELRFEHPSNARLDLLTREIWTGLNLVVADAQGRLLDNPALILARLFPYEYGQITTDMIEASLVSLAAQNWLMRYEIAGMHLIQILQWWEGNSIQYAYPSKYPAPIGWDDRTIYNKRSQKFTENWNGHRDQKPRIGQPFAPNTTAKVEGLPRKSSQLAKVEGLPKGTESEIEKESESEVEKESKDASASSGNFKENKAAEAAEAADLVILKIFQASGVRKKHLEYLTKTPGLQPADCWAMLAWCYAQNKFNKPGVIMAENILSGEKASADWYDESRWTVIPREIRQAGGLANIAISGESCGDAAGSIAEEGDDGPEVRLNSSFFIQGQEKQESQLDDVAIRITKPDETITTQQEQWWQAAISQMQTDMPYASFDTWVRDTVPVHWENGELQVGTKSTFGKEWLESRLSSTAVRLLSGIANQAITIKFVVREETPA
jgi:hypothetical protein